MTTIYLLNLSYPTINPDYHHTLVAYSTREMAEKELTHYQETATENAVYSIEEKPLF